MNTVDNDVGFQRKITLTSISDMWSHCFGLSSPARNAIRSRAVNLVCLLEDTNTRTGLAGEWVLIAAEI